MVPVLLAPMAKVNDKGWPLAPVATSWPEELTLTVAPAPMVDCIQEARSETVALLRSGGENLSLLSLALPLLVPLVHDIVIESPAATLLAPMPV